MKTIKIGMGGAIAVLAALSGASAWAQKSGEQVQPYDVKISGASVGERRFDTQAAELEAALDARIAAAKGSAAVRLRRTAEPEGGCLFGDDLVQMARMRDLEVGPERVLRPGDRLIPIEVQQLIYGIRAHTLLEAFDMTDDEEFQARDIRDIAHGRDFVLFVYHAGDNAHGFIYEKGTLRRVAEISDGAIQGCTVGFSNYGALPWFYTR